MFALVDCHNFYVSCERVFQPQYKGKPVIVLSNNDGCAIARSEEAKALGIGMAQPVHLIEEIIRKNNVKKFSSNYTLYGDMSSRVMRTLSHFAPHLEVYSIDEAFLLLDGMTYTDLSTYALQIKNTVKQHTGIPVGVGIAPTKTLAKLANRYAKKVKREMGVHALDTREKLKEVLQWAGVGDVWGIGQQYEKKLQEMKISTAYQFTTLPEEWIRKELSVVGQRLYYELKGVSCLTLEELPSPKKVICTSRSFGSIVTDLSELKQAVANFAAKCAWKLRQQKSCTGMIQVFLNTNVFRKQDSQLHRQVTIQIPTATSSTVLLIMEALRGLERLYVKGYNYHKAGVIAMDLVPQAQVQQAFFDKHNHKRDKKMMEVMDKVNYYLGEEKVKIASQGYSKKWKLKTEHLSRRYTTRLAEVVQVKH